MKNSLKYVILIILFIVLVISVTVSNLFIKYETKGEFNYKNKYYEIKYSNITMNNNQTMVKIDEENNSIHISIPTLEKKEVISFDITNIGNSDIIFDNYSITNIDTIVNTDNVIVNTSINKNELIKGGNSKKVIINIINNNKNNGYYNFNINCLFKES